MIEQAITVFYGGEGEKLSNLQKTELMVHTIPEKKDSIIVDEEEYIVSKRIFNTNDGNISVLAINQQQPYSDNLQKRIKEARKQRTKTI